MAFSILAPPPKEPAELPRIVTREEAAEKRPPPASAGPGVDHFLDFFAAMRAGCEVERVVDAELDREWLCEEISLYRMRARGGP